jgi:propanediol utilization protein
MKTKIGFQTNEISTRHPHMSSKKYERKFFKEKKIIPIRNMKSNKEEES